MKFAAFSSFTYLQFIAHLPTLLSSFPTPTPYYSMVQGNIVLSVSQPTVPSRAHTRRPKRGEEEKAMPVPRRRGGKSGMGFQISDVPKMALRLFDINYIFSKTRIALFYGFAPAIFYIGMTTEPRPQSWFEPFNILE